DGQDLVRHRKHGSPFFQEAVEEWRREIGGRLPALTGRVPGYGPNAPGPPTRGPRETRGLRGAGSTGARVFVQYARGERRPGVPAKSQISWGGRPGVPAKSQISWGGRPGVPAKSQISWGGYAFEIRRHFFNRLLSRRETSPSPVQGRGSGHLDQGRTQD